MIGKNVIIEDDVFIGDNCKIGHNVILKTGTVILDNVIIADNCCTTGACWIGNKVNIRTGAVISNCVIIEDWCFIGPGVMTNHTKHVDWGRDFKSEKLLTNIGWASVIGSGVSIIAGINIGSQSIIGAESLVTKDLSGHAIYLGSPVKKMIVEITDQIYTDKDSIINLDEKDVFKTKYEIDLEPVNSGNMYVKEAYEHIKKYISNLKHS
jgi:acetyltransferase-like isoleucine patch superfamily enzyme